MNCRELIKHEKARPPMAKLKFFEKNVSEIRYMVRNYTLLK